MANLSDAKMREMQAEMDRFEKELAGQMPTASFIAPPPAPSVNLVSAGLQNPTGSNIISARTFHQVIKRRICGLVSRGVLCYFISYSSYSFPLFRYNDSCSFLPLPRRHPPRRQREPYLCSFLIKSSEAWCRRRRRHLHLLLRTFAPWHLLQPR